MITPSQSVRRILLSNDDGIEAPGLQVLFRTLVNQGYDVIAVAPQGEQSTIGHSLTLHKPLYAVQVRENQYAITGTPADCVYLGTAEFCKERPPDLILSGINRGANLGSDVYYSGTVAASREGYLSKYPAIAVSLVIIRDDTAPFDSGGEQYYQSAADMVIELLERYVPLVLGHVRRFLWNVNVPNRPRDQLKGFRFCTLGERFYSNALLKRQDPRGRNYYWVAGNLIGHNQEPDTDCMALEQNYVSVTPLQIDCSNRAELAQLLKFQENLS